jgi:outer membrane receptor protein involved in Fe transport
VELDAAARAFKYSTFGSGVTGKLSGLIRTVWGVAVRGTYGTAFRAPNIGELYSGQSDSFPSVPDPCDTAGNAQCIKEGVPNPLNSGTIQQRARVGGNPGLQPEHAKVGTAGVVYEPLAGLDFTLDYWRLQIDEAIATIPAETILGQCYNSGVQQFCDLITRDPGTHNISAIADTIQNVGSRSTSGLDFSAAYSYKVKGAGTLRHAVEGTYLFKQNLDTATKNADGSENIIHGRGNYDLGINPDVKINLFTQWSHPSGISAGFNARFIDGFRECDGGCNTPQPPPMDGMPPNLPRHVSAYATGDLFFNYALKSRQGVTQIAVGLNNVINAKPAIIYTGGALNSDESAYDFLGRFLYIRLGQAF